MSITLSAALIASLAVAAEPSPTPGPRIERSEWRGTVRPGATVTVENAFGDVHARFGGYEGGVEAYATVQAVEPGRPLLALVAETSETGARLRVAYPAGSPAYVGGRDRADLAIFVPLGARFVVTTADGGIRSRGVRSDIVARTSAGEINISQGSGGVEARSDSGAILVALEPPKPGTTCALETVTGDIIVSLFERSDATLQVATSGDLCSDFSITIEHHDDREPSKVGTVRLGDGTRLMTVRSRQGAVRLQRRPPLPGMVGDAR